MSSSHTSLRRAAILLTSLPAGKLDAFLAELDEASQARLRTAVERLEDVPSDEQCRVIEEFLTALESEVQAAGPSLGSIGAVQTGPSETRGDATSGLNAGVARFGFLSETPAESLARLLVKEQPQTVAVVAAHLPVERVVDLLKRLPAAFRASVLQRLATFDDVDAESVQAIEQEMELLLAEAQTTFPEAPVGLTTVRRILAAAGTQESLQWVNELAGEDGALAEHLENEMPSEQTQTPEGGSSESSLTPSNAVNSGVKNTADRLAVQTRKVLVEDKAVVPKPVPSRLLAFADLEYLDDAALARVLQDCDPHTIMLALACARQSFVTRLVNQLPGRESRELQKRLRGVGPLLLSDVETAQQRLAEAANELAARGEIAVQMKRHLLTMA
ncbi:MAG: FliG C-terminal domain-containing protein [Planctomycetota bacterium]|nr:FliG C-terminal domain-containing protein [Planctomycetota bacterium]